MSARLILITLVMLPVFLRAESGDDVAAIRAACRQVDASSGQLTQVQATCPGNDGQITLTGWVDGADVRKITVRRPHLDGYEQIYLQSGRPVMVFSHYARTPDASGSSKGDIEERIYLKGGDIISWVSTDKTFVPHAEDAQGMQQQISSELPKFQRALKKAASKPDAAATGQTSGIFKDIEWGDYAHWMMTDDAGKDVALFVLNAGPSVQKVLDNPEAFHGRRCVVTWKRSMEMLPEAGQKTLVTQIIDVTWPREGNGRAQ